MPSSAPTATAIDTPLSDAGYQPLATRHGVAVYRDHSSRIISVGADGSFDATPTAVRDVLLDYDSQVGVIERLARCDVLERSVGRMVIYQRLALPIINDRDFIIVVTHTTDDDGAEVSIEHRSARADDVADELPPPASGAVRVEHNAGTWHLRRRADGTTQARLTFSIDIGGWIPRPVARVSGGHEVPAIFQAVRRLLARGGAPTPM